MPQPYYALQAAFTGGEVSDDVASRVDHDKYQLALLTAENVIVKPYGGISKRSGTRFVAACKYNDKKCILVRFNHTSDHSFMLEVGHNYIRVWDREVFTGIEMTSPFQESDLEFLRFTQSADTMFICSRKYPVQVLKRNSDTNWSLGNFEPDYPYFEQSTGTGIHYGAEYSMPGSFTFTPLHSGRYRIEVSGAGGGGLYHVSGSAPNVRWVTKTGGSGNKLSYEIELVSGTNYSVSVGAAGTNGYTNLSPVDNTDSEGNIKTIWTPITTLGASGGSSSFNGSVAGGGANATGSGNGSSNGNGLGGGGGYYNYISGSDIFRFRNEKPVYQGVNPQGGKVSIAYIGNNSLKPSAKTGFGVTITSKLDTFDPKHLGSYIKLYHDVPSETVSVTNGMTPTLQVINAWKITTHGTWTGKVTVEKSTDTQTWVEHRKYTAANDFNVQETGTFEDITYLRVTMAITSGSCSADLTAMPYRSDGYGKIVEYVSAKQVKINVLDQFESIAETEFYAFSAWSELNGYPSCSCFFQDRLSFAANKAFPYMIWMSRTGDYYNFKVEKALGNVTDDSAIALSAISREEFHINHLVPSKDLVVLTNGNEWIIPGDNAVTPTNAKIVTQSSRGTNECEPQFIGNRVIYVQRRGGTVRDMGYSFESDNYAGDDLTQLAKHLVNGYDLVDSTFAQEPFSIIYFVRNDGVVLCLTYIREQKVFAWSKLTTAGSFESIANIQYDQVDNVFAVVKRSVGDQEVRYIEVFEQQVDSSDIEDYILMDCAHVLEFEEPTTTITSLDRLIGAEVQVMADGRLMPDAIVSESGSIEIPQPSRRVVVGLKYVTRIEQPNLEIQSKDGTFQGRYALISDVVLRLKNSLGGEIGLDFEYMDEISFDGLLTDGKYELFTGDKKQTVPSQFVGGTRLRIKHDKPYPLSINAIVRVVAMGG